MLVLRLTTKAFKKIHRKPQLIEVDQTENNFGEWCVNTVESINRGNLCMAVMHAESLYTMLVPISKNMAITDFLHSIFANMLFRMVRLEVPRPNAHQVVDSYKGYAVFAKTNSRHQTAHLSTILKDAEAILERPGKYAEGNKLNLSLLECRINDAPRGFNGKTIWPLEKFYHCIRRFCPELPFRQALPLDYTEMTNPGKLEKMLQRKISEKLALKARASSLGAEVLFDINEIQAILKAVEESPSQLPAQAYADLKCMLTYQVDKCTREVFYE